MAGTLVLRADAGPEQGTGHVWRALALAQAWQDAGGDAVLATAALPPELAARVEVAGLPVDRLRPGDGAAHDAAETLRVVAQRGAVAVALDHYGLGAGWQARVQRRAPLLAWDDYLHQPRYAVDLLVHPQPLADPAVLRAAAPGAEVRAGAAYVTLRRELRAPAPRPPRDHLHLLVSFGGVDPGGWTRRAVRALGPLPAGVRATALGGLLGSGTRALGPPWTALRHTDDMPGLLATVDLVVGAGGTSTWERCAQGVPQVLVELADNQRLVARAAEGAGAARALGPAERLDPARLRDETLRLLADPVRRGAMSAAGRALVDGQGGARVVEALQAAIRRRSVP